MRAITKYLLRLTLLAAWLCHAVAQPGNYCGSDYAEAKACNAAASCPSGKAHECDTGGCWGVETCGSGDKPVCGRDAGGEECPLRACCSKHGFCGWTKEFCELECKTDQSCSLECQSNCGTIVPPPPCTAAAADVRSSVRWGYWESWSTARECPELPQPPLGDLDLSQYTHLAYSFAHVSATNELVLASSADAAALAEFTALKATHPQLRLVVAVGGWAFNDPPTQARFSNMAASAASRATFVSSTVAFLSKHGLDGVDIDWEYPGADDRGGTPDDTANYVLLLSDLRAALAPSQTLTIAVPLSFWYLRHFDLLSITPLVDWLNVMSYDLHGVWDADIESEGAFARPHTDLNAIKERLSMFYKNEVPPDKLVLGLAGYARTYKLDADCAADGGEGCTFVEGGTPGVCTQAAGTLAYFEVEALVLSEGAAAIQTDAVTQTASLRVGDDWIAFDTHATLGEKVRFAEQQCLRGWMLWAVDLIPNGIGTTAGGSGGSGGGGGGDGDVVVEEEPPEAPATNGCCPGSHPASWAGIFCSRECSTGSRGFGAHCVPDCPTDFRDDGLFCAKPAPYGRGAGYPWQFTDGLNNDGMLARCSAEHDACEMWGAIAYPVCSAGFHAVGCCICSPDCPWDGDIGVSCTKPLEERGAPVAVDAQCAMTRVKDGLKQIYEETLKKFVCVAEVFEELFTGERFKLDAEQAALMRSFGYNAVGANQLCREVIVGLEPVLGPTRTLVEAAGCFADFTLTLTIGAEASIEADVGGIAAAANLAGFVGVAFSSSGPRGCFAGHCVGAFVSTPSTPSSVKDYSKPSADGDLGLFATVGILLNDDIESVGGYVVSNGGVEVPWRSLASVKVGSTRSVDFEGGVVSEKDNPDYTFEVGTSVGLDAGPQTGLTVSGPSNSPADMCWAGVVKGFD